MRHGRLFITMLAALAIMATAPAWAAAAPGSLLDDSAADFGAGDPGTATIAAAGSVALKHVEQFDGATLPAGLTSTPWSAGGAATVGGGIVTVDGDLVDGNRALNPDQVLEFTGTFGATAAHQHVGLAANLGGGPWAIFSTGDTGGGLSVRTNGATAQDTPVAILGFDLAQPHTYRIEWTATQVSYLIDGTPVATHPIVVAGPMHLVVSDGDLGGDNVKLDSFDLGFFSNPGAFTSRVLDTGHDGSTFGALNADVTANAATGVTFETRSGPTPTPGGAGWSSFAGVANGGTITSPHARYIQYRANFTTTNEKATATLNSVTIGYDDNVGSGTSTGGGGTVGGGQTSGGSGTTTTTQQSSGGSSTVAAVDKTKPKVTLVAKSLKASKKGTVSFTVGCPATETSCTIKLQLKNGKQSIASKTVTVKGGKTKTVTLTLNAATKKLLKKRSSLKVSTVLTATDAAGNKRKTTKQATLRRAAA